GGPVGIDTIAASIGEERVTIEDVYEPYLLQAGFLHRTKQGRVASRDAWRWLGLEPPETAETSGVSAQTSLFDADTEETAGAADTENSADSGVDIEDGPDESDGLAHKDKLELKIEYAE
ncbi:MAG: hypothetical protein FWF33_07340, partial [Clostridiales bacterium]|nr:hypothetical protein [Clostridiales bacterium]